MPDNNPSDFQKRPHFHTRLIHKQPKRIQAGFTILEMLVVTVLIGIVAAIGLSGYQGLNKRLTAQSQAEQFRSLIRDGATLANSRSLPLTLGITSGIASLKNGTTVLRSLNLSGISTNLGTSVINFSTDGRVTMPATPTTLTVNINGSVKTLQVSGIGQTRWQ